jgi:uncharacterized protein (DUF2249 family)
VLKDAKLETELVREEVRHPKAEDAFGGLKCGESLAIAVNHIGEDAFGIKKLLRRTLRVLGRS